MFSSLAMNYGRTHFLCIFDFGRIYMARRAQNPPRTTISVGACVTRRMKSARARSRSGLVPGSLVRELGTHFSSLAVHNRKNLFVYCGKLNDYYMRFREDYHPTSTHVALDDSLVLSESQHIASEPPSPQISNSSNAPKPRQRHDSVRGGFTVETSRHCVRPFPPGHLVRSCHAVRTEIWR